MAGLFDDVLAPASSSGIFDDVLRPTGPDETGIMGTLAGGARQTARSVGAALDVFQNDLPELQQAAAAQQSGIKDPRLIALQQDIAARKERLGSDYGWLDAIREVGGAAMDNPAGAGLMMLEQLPNSAAVMAAGGAGALAGSALGPAGTAAGAIAGGIGGMFLGNTALETGGKALEHVSQTGALAPEDRSRLMTEGAVKGGVITGIDAATLGLTSWITGTGRRAAERAVLGVAENAGVPAAEIAARRAADPAFDAAVLQAQKLAVDGANTLGQRVAQTGGALALETFGEGAGEYLGEFAATGEADKIEAVIEAFSSLGQSAGEIAGSYAWNKSRLSGIMGAQTTDDAIAATETALTGATGAIDAFKTGDMGVAGLLSAPVSPTLQVTPDGTVGTAEQLDAASEAQRLGAMGPLPAEPDGPGAIVDSSLPLVGQERPVAPDVRAEDLLGQPTGLMGASEPLVTPKARVLSDIEAYQAAQDKQARGELLSSYERAILDAGPPSTPSKLVTEPARGMSAAEIVQRQGDRIPQQVPPVTQRQLAQEETPGAAITVSTNTNGVPVISTQGAEQTAALTAALKAAKVTPHTINDGTVRVPKATPADVLQQVVARLNTQYSAPRQPQGEAAATTQGERDGMRQGQETAEALRVAQVFGPGARLRTMSDVQPGERVTPTMRKVLTQLGRLTGTKVVFIASEGADGATRSADGNTVYVNTRASVNPLQVMGHEVTHVLKRKHRNAWAAIRTAVEASTDDAALQEFARNYWSQDKTKLDASQADGALDTKPDWLNTSEASMRDFLIDEMISDLGGERWSDPAFWSNVFADIEAKHGFENGKSIIQKLVAAIKDLINRFMILAKQDGFAEFQTEGQLAKRISPEQLLAVHKAIESAYAEFIAAERTNEPAGYTRGAAPVAATSGTDGGDASAELTALEEGMQQTPRRTSDVGHTRTKSGDYVGAPPGMTPGKLGALRKTLMTLTKEGEPGRFWYEDSSRAILEAAEGDKALAEKIAGLLAIYSPQMTVGGNTTVGLKALYQWMNGKPIDAKTGSQDEKAQAWMDGTMGEDDALQIKTGNFFKNLMRKIDEERYGFEKQGATIDMWMARVFGYGSKAIGSEARYYFAEREVKRIADALGWEPQQVQAALWVSIKSRVEEIADAAREYGKSQGWLNRKVVKTKGKENISWPPKPEFREQYESHILKMALGISGETAATGIAKSKYNFETALKERVGQISWEAKPGRTSGVLPGIFDAPLEQQVEYLVAMDKALRDENGNDLIAAKLGLPVLYTNMGPSAWQMDVAAGAQTTVAVATDRDQGNKKITINDNARQLLNAYAAIRGYVLSQEAVVWHYPLFDEAKVRANGIQIDIGRDPSVDETRQLYQAVFDATGRDDWAPAFVPTVGWRVLNFDDTVPNKEFAKLIIDVLKSLPDSFPASSVDTFKSEGDYISNDWKENPNGEGYRSWISGAGRSDLQGWVEGDLRDRTRRVEQEFAERYGWDQRPDAASDRQDRTGAEGRSESLPRYGRPIDGNAVTAFGLHYSKAQRDELSSAYFGTGMKAEERIRLGIAKDPRIKRRLYFYTDTGRGIVPESDVGAHAHSVQLDNLYDMDVDALKLYKRENEDGSYRSDHTRMNEFESAIIDAGYDGYVTHQFGKGGAAVLLGTHSVPVKYEGTGAGATVPRTAGPRFPEARQLQRDIMADRSLPSGQMKGSEWKRMLADRVDLRYLEDDKYYYKSDLIPRESTRRMAPNGKPSNLSEQQWLQVRTPEFKAWFGDWEKHAKADNPVGSLWYDDKVSKVVDENGEPLVVYHGTKKGGFTVMDPDKGDKHRSPMIFAAKTRDTARTYAGRGQEIDLTAATVDVAPRKIGKEWYAVDKTGDGSYAYNVYGEYVPVEDAESYISANEAQFFIDTDLEQVLQDSGDHQAGVYPLFLNIRNPNESDFEGGNWDGHTNGLYEVLGEDGDNIYADDGRRLMPLDEAEVLVETVDGAEVNSVDWLGESTNSVAEEAKRMDMDGAIIRNVVDDGGQGYNAYADDVFVFFDSNQAKSATQNTGAFSPTDPDIRRSESRAPIYYSQLARSVEQAPVKVFSTGKQVAAWLAGNASKLGVKKDEIEATGVTDWLQTQGKVTREQVSEYLAQGGVQVSETVLGRQFDPDNPTLPTGWQVVSSSEYPQYTELSRKFKFVAIDVDDMPMGWGNSESDAIADAYSGNPQYFESSSDTKFAGYVPPGGEEGTYREVLLTLPQRVTDVENVRLLTQSEIDKNSSLAGEKEGDWWGIVDDNGTPLNGAWRTIEQALDQFIELKSDGFRSLSTRPLTGEKRTGPLFKSQHWDQPNVIAHMRVDTAMGADGGKYLRVLEIQSDWAQKGRKDGFNAPPVKGTVFQQDSGDWGVRWEDGNFSGGYSREGAERAAAEGSRTKGIVPSAPFVTDTGAWTRLVIKRAIRMAVDEGLTGIVFATGQQNADLYDLSKTLSKVVVSKQGVMFKIGGTDLRGDVHDFGTHPAEKLEDIVGKDLAAKIMQQKTPNDVYVGNDLKVGGEGMRAYYDKIVPQEANSVLKQLGAGVKVGQVQLATYKPATGQPIGDAELDAEVDRMIEDAFGDEATPPQEARYIPTTTQPGFALTPELRATAQAGMPMFSTSRATANRWAYQNRQFVQINDQKFQDTTDREFARVVAEFDKTRDPEMLRAVIPAMAQPNVLQMLGLPNQWLGWLGDIVAKVRSKHKVMLPGDKLNELLRSPALVIQSGDDLEIISDHVVNGDPLMFAIIPDTTETFGLRPGEKLRITQVKSAYPLSWNDKVVDGKKQTGLSNRLAGAHGRKILYADQVKTASLFPQIRPDPGTGNSQRADYWVGEIEKRLREKKIRGYGDLVNWIDDRYKGAPENEPVYSTPRSQIRQSWSLPSLPIPGFDTFIRQMQDKLVDTKRVVAAIRAAGVTVKERFDPYLQETLFHGRAAKKVNDFAQNELRPLFEDMNKLGVETAELQDYLWARHAAERNAQIAKVNANMPDGGSGLTNQQASDILVGQPVTVAGRTIQINPRKMASYQLLANRVRTITNSTLDLLVASGLESQQTVDTWRNTYQNYVPLMRDMESDDNYLGAFGLGMGTGQGFSVRGAASKRAMGSERGVVDILANVAMQRERAITRAEKNRVAQAVYGLALTAPNPDFWLPVNPDDAKPQNRARVLQELIDMGVNPIDAQNIAMEPRQTYTDPRTGLVMQRINPALRGRDNVLSMRVDGKDRFIYFSSNERANEMVRNLKNLDAESLNGFLQIVAPATRYFASINTQFNPIFGITNGIRDVFTGMLNLSSTDIKDHRAEVLKNAYHALRGIYIDLRDHRAGVTPSSAWAQEFEEFAREGGQTGYRDMFPTSEARAKAIEREIRKAGKGEEKWKVFSEDHPVGGWLSDYNTSIENAVRLAAYKTYKDTHMRAGMTPAEQSAVRQRAAATAKNLTVNFNKKGLAATQMGAMYAFFNAAVQGTARIAETMTKRDPATGKVSLTDAGKKIAYGGMMVGVMQAVMFALAGYDDEEPPQFIREKNFIIPLPGSDKYLSIPMPLGFHVLPNIGRIATEFLLSGGKNPAKRITQMAGTIADAFNPLGSSTPLQMLSPTVVDPLTALAENRDWSGKSIYKEDFNSLQPTAGWTRAKDTASPFGKFVAQATNYLTGGGKYQIGVVSPTPDQIDYLVGQITGGLGREVTKGWTTASSAAAGEELPLYKIPGIGRFAGETTGQAPEMGKFYDNIKRIGEHESALKEIKRQRDTKAYVEYMRENPDAAKVQQADKAYRDIALLKKQKRDAVEAGDRKRVQLIDAQLTGRVRRYNKLLSTS